MLFNDNYQENDSNRNDYILFYCFKNLTSKYVRCHEC